MFTKTIYLGYYPLGGDLKINGIKVMQSKWKKLRKPILVAFGKSHKGVKPFFCEPFVVEVGGKRAFFLASEVGIGKYHVFGLSEKVNQKLCGYRNIKVEL